jgi:hypothetical protein
METWRRLGKMDEGDEKLEIVEDEELASICTQV